MATEIDFSISINDDSEVLSDLTLEENSKFIELYNWQQRAIEYFLKHEKAIFEVSTGAGKSFCAIQIIKEILKKEPDLRVLIVVPKNIILEDTWFRELYNAGFTLRDVGVYYAGIHEYAKITITNMQNLENVNLNIFDMGIWDELHNYGATKKLKFLEKPMKYKLGLSATVERMDGNHWKIMKLFNYNKFIYSPKEALSDGVLNPFNFFNIAVEMDDKTTEEYEFLSQEINAIIRTGGSFGTIMRSNTGLKYKMLSIMNQRKQLVNNYPRKFNVIKAIVEKHSTDKILVFNQFNAQTNRVYWHLMDVGANCRVLHSGINKETREQILIDYRNDKFNVLLTSKILDEGYNLPAIQVGVIMAGDSSPKQTIQRMGRILRKKEKRSNLYQVYVKDTIEEDQSIERSKIFKELSIEYYDYLYRLDSEEVFEDY
jgi:superfamily II DNA or RNA helicase